MILADLRLRLVACLPNLWLLLGPLVLTTVIRVACDRTLASACTRKVVDLHGNSHASSNCICTSLAVNGSAARYLLVTLWSPPNNW